MAVFGVFNFPVTTLRDSGMLGWLGLVFLAPSNSDITCTFGKHRTCIGYALITVMLAPLVEGFEAVQAVHGNSILA